MTPEQRKQIEAKLIKRGFTQLSQGKEGIWIREKVPNMRLVDLNKTSMVKEFAGLPVVCISTGIERIEEGHGVPEVDEIRGEIMSILKWKVPVAEPKPEPPAQSPKTEIKPAPENHAPTEKPVKIIPCRKCGIELSQLRAAELFKRGDNPICDECEEKTQKPKGDRNMEQHKTELKEAEIVKDNLPARKQEFKVGTCEAVAIQYGIPSELANLFFMKMNEGLYIKNPGLLYLAGKKGYSRIEITDKFDQTTQEWSAECKIYPKVSKEILEGIAKLDKEMQKSAFEFMTNPTNGTGRASKNNVKMTSMQAFLREMAQTRAQNRALRAFIGYGGTSAEELPEGHIEEQ